jgi:3-isopropylmalate/(R)-2-methylmalate dehydratase small subunit
LNPDFVLNDPRYAGARILLARHNFGCGSSREHAPWALEDYGFRVLIAPSFADIFHQNAVKNGLVPVVLDERVIDELFALATGDEPLELEIDLHNLRLHPGRGHEALGSIEIVIDPFHHHCLIHGLDDIGLTLKQEDAIVAYEERRRAEAPWLFA